MSRPDVSPGSTVGAYTVQGELGRTAWSDTYVASADGERKVALKVMDAEDVGEETWRVVAAKRKVLASIPEHLVLPIVDVGSDDEARIRWIATPLSEHPSLVDLVAIYAMSPSEAVLLLKNLAIAVDDAHSRGLVHLALKPSNVFVGPPPTHAVRLADFTSDTLRRAKKDPGDLMWLAPEQIDDPDKGGPQSDVFSVALLTFYAVTGKPYWTASAADEAALLEEIRGPRVLPSERARALGATFPAALDADLLRALGPIEGRFGSARSLADALEQTLTEPPPPVDRSSERHLKATQQATQRVERFTLEGGEAAPPAVTTTLETPPVELPEPPVTATPVAPPPPRPRSRPKMHWSQYATKPVRVPQWAVIVTAGTVMLLLLLIAVGLVRRARKAAQATDVPPTTTTAEIAPAPSVTEEPAPPPSEPTSSAEPAHSAEPAASPSPSPSPSPSSPPGDEGELEIVCSPPCDRVFIGGKLTKNPERVRLPPGKYGIGVGRTGYSGQFRNVVVKAGERQTVSFTLSGADGGRSRK